LSQSGSELSVFGDSVGIFGADSFGFGVSFFSTFAFAFLLSVLFSDGLFFFSSRVATFDSSTGLTESMSQSGSVLLAGAISFVSSVRLAFSAVAGISRLDGVFSISLRGVICSLVSGFSSMVVISLSVLGTLSQSGTLDVSSWISLPPVAGMVVSLISSFVSSVRVLSLFTTFSQKFGALSQSGTLNVSV
jgi:hypothetical protein